MDYGCRSIPNLSAIRNQQGISLRSIAEATKIRLFYLEAIEKGEFGKLPGRLYTRSYICQYARAIDFDETELLGALPPDTETEDAHSSELPPGLWRRFLRFISSTFAHGTVDPRRT